MASLCCLTDMFLNFSHMYILWLQSSNRHFEVLLVWGTFWSSNCCCWFLELLNCLWCWLCSLLNFEVVRMAELLSCVDTYIDVPWMWFGSYLEWLFPFCERFVVSFLPSLFREKGFKFSKVWAAKESHSANYYKEVDSIWRCAQCLLQSTSWL